MSIGEGGFFANFGPGVRGSKRPERPNLSERFGETAKRKTTAELRDEHRKNPDAAIRIVEARPPRREKPHTPQSEQGVKSPENFATVTPEAAQEVADIYGQITAEATVETASDARVEQGKERMPALHMVSVAFDGDGSARAQQEQERMERAVQAKKRAGADTSLITEVSIQDAGALTALFQKYPDTTRLHVGAHGVENRIELGNGRILTAQDLMRAMERLTSPRKRRSALFPVCNTEGLVEELVKQSAVEWAVGGIGLVPAAEASIWTAQMLHGELDPKQWEKYGDLTPAMMFAISYMSAFVERNWDDAYGHNPDKPEKEKPAVLAGLDPHRKLQSGRDTQSIRIIGIRDWAAYPDNIRDAITEKLTSAYNSGDVPLDKQGHELLMKVVLHDLLSVQPRDLRSSAAVSQSTPNPHRVQASTATNLGLSPTATLGSGSESKYPGELNPNETLMSRRRGADPDMEHIKRMCVRSALELTVPRDSSSARSISPDDLRRIQQEIAARGGLVLMENK